ncbi:MAG: SMP-30/gluconolactonase/LRE family protein [Chthoniobacter sp.]|uniref:SMP-30/gluconolactonase/LRE family protein n=1 Tax=Chthoniobacter sp. TaxID=2510640 RepID=UPI0032A9B5D4
MKRLLPFALSIATLLATPTLRAAEPDYPVSEDSKVHDNVPKGELIKFDFAQSKIFPGTTREVTIYVPKQYDGTKPACVYVNQDGVQWGAPVVFDNLIAKGDIPVTIGVFSKPGVVKALDGKAALDRFNRSYEYDGMGDGYARFVLDELLPAVEQKTTSDGHKILLSKNGNDRAIGGSSSGAICAFIAAWERPDAFTRVFTSVCTMVGLRGANVYPTLVRKYEPKPIRVFQVDGSNDNNIYGGDWWMANQELERSLTFAGYEHEHVWGEGGHSGKQGTALFPDVMRFLWKGWPTPVKAGEGSPQLKEILIPGEGWQQVWEGGKFTEGMSSNAKGEVFFTDVPNSKTYKIALDGKITEFIADSHKGLGQAFGPDGKLYAVAGGAQQIVAYDENAQAKTIAEGFRGNDLVVLHNGNVYVTEPGWDGTKPSNVWLIKPDGTKSVVDTGLKFSNGITVSPDQSLLYVADSRSHWVYSYQIQPDGLLNDKQRYYHLHMPDTADDSGADGMEVDSAGRLYVATRLGLQVCDQAGRVNCIIPTPNGKVSNVVFGGADFDTLYVSAGDKIYKRKVHAKAAPSFAAPIKPAAPHL